MIEGGAVEIFTDEDHGVLPRFGAPGVSEAAFDLHVNSLEKVAVGFVFDRKDTFHSIDVGSFLLNEIRDPSA